MTDLRQAAQQALDAWDDPMKDLKDLCVAMDGIRTALEQQAEPSQWRDMVVVSLVREGVNKHKARELADHFTAPPQQQAEPVAWDVFELRLYGAPQEKQHRVLWVERYIYPDGSTPDLDSLLDAAKTEGGIDGRAKTLHVRPLYTTPPQRQWVGLTDDDVKYPKTYNLDFVYGTRWAEKKLKERNNG